MIKINTILTGDELIDKCLRRAAKIEIPYDRIFEEKIRKENIGRISTIESISVGYLKKTVRRFPGIERIHPYYEDLIDLKFGRVEYKRSLNNVEWAADKIVELSTDSIKKIKKTKEAHNMVSIRKEFYGRFCSIIEHIDGDLKFLSKVRGFIKKLPDVEADIPYLIIGGMPNVGKSSLVNALTGGKIKTAPYPFTTLDVSVGHYYTGDIKIGVIDTPGLLDRDFESMNEMEKKAILAMKDIKGEIIFLIDYSESCGYSVESQMTVLENLKKNFRKEITSVQAKVDISDVKLDICVSVHDAKTIERFKKIMEEKLIYAY
ncbi:NOG1 family protein [Caldiplasma sukawensis]